MTGPICALLNIGCGLKPTRGYRVNPSQMPSTPTVKPSSRVASPSDLMPSAIRKGLESTAGADFQATQGLKTSGFMPTINP